MTHVTANSVQQAFRAYNDDGSLTAATAIAGENANWSQVTDEVFRVRFAVEETAGGDDSWNASFEYQINGGGWNSLGTTTPVQATASGTVSDGATISTQRLSVGSTFVNGVFDSNASDASAITINNSHTEFEVCLTLDSGQLSDGDTVQIRVAGLDSWTNTPSITASVPFAGTLTCNTGSYSVTGNAVTLTYNQLAVTLAIDSGTYAVSGNAVGLQRQLVMSMDSSSYSVTGNNVDLNLQKTLSIESGGYAVSGNIANLSYASADLELTQTAFRAREDDNGESAATWIDALNTDWAQVIGEAFRLRFHIQETGGGQTDAYLGLQYKINAGGWADVTGTSAVSFAGSGFVADNAATSQQISTEVSAYTLETADGVTTNIDDAGLFSFDSEFWNGTTFVAGLFESDGEISQIALTAFDETEVEFCLVLNGGQVSDTDTIQFRVTNAGSVLDVYTATPELIAQAAAAVTLTIDSGSYVTSGNSVNLTAQRAMQAVTGSYAVTGNDLNLTADRVLGIEAGAYTVSGQAVGLPASRVLTTDSGAYAATGNDVGLFAGRLIAADTGSYTVAGQSTNLAASLILSLDAGVYSVSGQAITFTTGKAMPVDSGSYAIGGNVVTLTADRVITLNQGSYVTTGENVTFTRSLIMPVGVGSYSQSGQDVALNAAKIFTLDNGSYSTAGISTGLIAARLLTPDSGSYLVSGNTLAFSTEDSLGLSVGGYALTGNDVGLIYDRIMSLNTGAYVLTGRNATLQFQSANDVQVDLFGGRFVTQFFDVGLIFNDRYTGIAQSSDAWSAKEQAASTWTPLAEADNNYSEAG